MTRLLIRLRSISVLATQGLFIVAKVCGAVALIGITAKLIWLFIEC